MTEFNLSKKIHGDPCEVGYYLKPDDVKEFIQKLKQVNFQAGIKLKGNSKGQKMIVVIDTMLDKLAGGELSK